MANGGHNRKYIKVLENEKNALLDNIESILEEICIVFEKLYTSPLGES